MTYEEFKQNILPQLNEIRSFAGKMRLAKENLVGIGSGTGRVVFDIDGEKVLKLAKNAKGIAQNEAEANIGYYRDTHHIVTEIYDSSDDNSWLIAQKASKVNEKRIKEITRIPSLNDLLYYLRNNVEMNKGGRRVFSQEPEVVEELNENEFVQDILAFVMNYSQEVGDMGRPSTYGEVVHDGQPAIVLTDYGLNDEVYQTHYSPERKQQRFQMYELFNFADGNDDILSDTGDQGDIRRGMWAQMPYSVSDGTGVINEAFNKFVSNRDSYPDKPISGLPILSDHFHECVNNIKEVLSRVDNKQQFYGNLLKLQEYLIRRGFYNREPLVSEEYVINEEEASVNDGSLADRGYVDEISSSVAQKLSLTAPRPLGGGANGFAYEINDNLVLKITTDISEADAASKLMRGKPEHISEVFNLYKVIDNNTNQAFYAILQENVNDKPLERLRRNQEIITAISPDGYDYEDIMVNIRKPKKFDYNQMLEFAKRILTDNPEANISQPDREAAYEYLVGMLNIRKELLDFGIKSTDYITIQNLGYKNGKLKYFDVGGYHGVEPEIHDKNIIQLPEDGSAKFSTDDAMGQDGFPAYNQGGDTSPSINNSLDANIAMYEDLIYNDIVNNAIKNKHQVSEDYLGDDGDVQMFRNPKSLIRLRPDIRGLINSEGDLFVADDTQYTIHYHIANWLVQNKHMGARGYGDLSKVIPVQRFENTNNFYLSEVIKDTDIEKNKNWISSIFLEAKRKNPTINFVMQNIGVPTYGDEEYVNVREDLEYKHVEGDATQDKYMLGEVVEGGEYQAYHGSDTKIEKFSDDFVGAEEATDQEGPGIYFTTDHDDAKGYGKFIYSAILRPRKLVDEGSHEHVSEQEIYGLIKMSPDWEISSSNWDEDPETGIRTAIDSFMRYAENEKDLFQQIWYDFFRHSPMEYLRGMVKLGYDGQVINKPNDRKHIIVYNPDIITITGSEVLSEERKKAWMSGSKVVKVKRKCQLAGLGNTSVACNQGDINNLEFSSVNEIGEGNVEASEGVGDKYAEEKFGIKPEFSNFEDKFRQKKSEEQNEVVYDNEFMLIKNPENLNNIGNSVRGIITKEGDLFIEQQSVVIHIDIINKLRDLGFVKMSYLYSIGEKHPSEYITVQRFGDSNDIVIGESNHQMRLYNQMYDKAAPVFQRFMDAAKRKNPSINFINSFVNDYKGGVEDMNEYFSSLVPDINESNIMAIQDLPFRQEIEGLGGEIYAVGGAVRDEFLGKDSKDLDIIIRGIPEDKLAQILNKYGKVNAVGESFAVTKFVPEGGTDEIDIAVPRTEVSTGEGHGDFEIKSDYRLPIEKDLERRDFTINAIAKDMEGNIIDPFNGMADLKSGSIRVTHPKSFEDDALRMLRAVQFASRFGFTIESETYKMIQANADKIKTITKERIQEEIQKIVDKGDPYAGAFLLKDTGLLRQMGVDAPLLVSTVWGEVKTLAEFVYLISHNAVNPVKFYMNNMRGDSDVINELQGLIEGLSAENLENPVINRSVVHNMIKKSKGTKVLESKILPQQLQIAAQELLQGKYPKTVNELAVNGNDIMSKGLKGKEVGDMQKMLLIKVYADNVRNSREELLSSIDENKTGIKENYAKYYDNWFIKPSTWDINGEQVGIDFFVREYDKWNIQGSSEGYQNASRESVLEFLQNNYEDNSTDDKLKKELYWALTDRDLLKEEPERTEKVEFGTLMLYLNIPNWKKITSVIEKNDVYEVDGEFGIETEPHITILYGFHSNVSGDDVFDLYKENYDLKPIEINIKGISIFENDEFDVVKMDVESKVLTKMNKLMQELPSTYPKYHAHITLAYVKKGTGEKYLKNFNEKRVISGDKLVFSTQKEKKNSIDLDKKGVLKENNDVKKISYSAVVLDNESHTKLVQVFQPMIPDGWEVIAHHMTIKMGGLDSGSKEKQDMEAETLITLNVTDYAMDNLVMAVGVDGYPTHNPKPHVTIAVNEADGGKAFYSNKLSDWKPLGFPLTLNGTVKELG